MKKEGIKIKGRKNGNGREERKRRKERDSQWVKKLLKIHRLNPTASCDLPSIFRPDSFVGTCMTPSLWFC